MKSVRSPVTGSGGADTASPSVLDKAVEEMCAADGQEYDDLLGKLSRDQALELPFRHRMRWFYLLQVMHRELARVIKDLSELLETDNEVKIISLIGMTGIGKTTLLGRLLERLVGKYECGKAPHEVPVIYVCAPANGPKSLSWNVLFQRIYRGGHEPLVKRKRAVRIGDDGTVTVRHSRVNLAELREMIERMLVNRNVRVLVIDEALHLLRFEDYAPTMDTLKSLADAHICKLLLVGHYNLVDLVCDYGQVSRRGEIVHFKRYAVGELGVELTDDQEEFRAVVRKLQDNWPNKVVPNLVSVWHTLMRHSLGSVGLLKIALVRMAILQARSKKGGITEATVKKSFKSPKALAQIESETVAGEGKLAGYCYGDIEFTKGELAALVQSA